MQITFFQIGDRVRCTHPQQESIVRVITKVRSSGYSYQYMNEEDNAVLEPEYMTEDSSDPLLEWWKLDDKKSPDALAPRPS